MNIIEKKTVNFVGDDLIAARGPDGKIYAAIRPVCENLGIDSSTQRRKITSHEVLSGCVVMMTSHDTTGRQQEMAVMDVRMLPAWLMTIHPSKVKESLRDKLVSYQKEAAEVLAQAFMDKKPPKPGEIQKLVYGNYRTAQMVAKASLTAAKLFGTRPSIANAVTAQLVRRETGIDWNQFLIENKSEVKESLVIPTTLGKALEPELKPNTVNKILEAIGLQSRFEYKPGSFEWRLTKAGKEFGDMIDIGRKHSDKSPIRTPCWYMDRTLAKIQEFLDSPNTEIAN